MKFLQGEVTLKDSQRLGHWIDSRSTSVTVNDLERRTAKDPVILFVLYGNKQNTSGDRQQP